MPLIGSLNSIMVSGTHGSVSTGRGDKQTAAMLGLSSCLSVCSTAELVVPRKGDLGSQSTCSGLGWCRLGFLCELDGAAACCCGPSCCTSQLGPLQGWLELYHSRWHTGPYCHSCNRVMRSDLSYSLLVTYPLPS